MEDESAEEDWDDLTTCSTQITPFSAGLGFNVGAAGSLRQLHPSSSHILRLSSYYVSNVDPMFKVLHIPSFQMLVTNTITDLDRIPAGDSSEALLFAVYYAATTTLTERECLAVLENGKETLLAQYRTGVERALSNADFLRRCDLRSLQALTIFLVGLFPAQLLDCER